MMAYGDLLRLYTTPDFSQVFSAMALLTGRLATPNRVAKTSWLANRSARRRYANLLNRVRTPWGNAEAYEVGVLYFLTLDPATLAPAA